MNSAGGSICGMRRLPERRCPGYFPGAWPLQEQIMPVFPRRFALALPAFLLVAIGVARAEERVSPTEIQMTATDLTTTSSGLRYTDTTIGTGASPATGQTCVMHYTGWLYENGVKGKKFDSSVDRGEPFEFPIGTGRVIKGWDEGVAGMKVGGKRTLVIPPSLGYGARGAGGVIPPNATLLFEVELIALK
jgi:peptidylprolyl isomerase